MSRLGPFALIKPFNVDPNRFVEARSVFSLKLSNQSSPIFPDNFIALEILFQALDLMVKVRFFHHSLPLDVATEESPNKNILHQCRCWLSAQCSTPGDSTCTAIHHAIGITDRSFITGLVLVSIILSFTTVPSLRYSLFLHIILIMLYGEMDKPSSSTARHMPLLIRMSPALHILPLIWVTFLRKITLL